MIGEISLAGIYVPTLLVLALLAFGLTRVLTAGLARTGWYRFVWHPPLFDIALFVIVLGAMVSASSFLSH